MADLPKQDDAETLHCLACDSDLTAAKGDICSECGAMIDRTEIKLALRRYREFSWSSVIFFHLAPAWPLIGWGLWKGGGVKSLATIFLVGFLLSFGFCLFSGFVTARRFYRQWKNLRPGQRTVPGVLWIVLGTMGIGSIEMFLVFQAFWLVAKLGGPDLIPHVLVQAQ